MTTERDPRQFHVGRRSAIAAIALLLATAASAQEGRPELRQVQDAWEKTLAGGVPAPTLATRRDAGTSVEQVQPVRSPEIVGCSADGEQALALVGRCRNPKNASDDPIPCGSAVVDLSAKRFVRYIASRSSGFAQQYFAGHAVVNAWEGGLEVRWGRKLERSRVLRDATLVTTLADERTLILALPSGGKDRLASYAPGDAGPRPLPIASEDVAHVESVPGAASLIVARVYDEGAPARVVVADRVTGKRVFEVRDVARHSVSSDGGRLFVVVPDRRGEQPRWRYELHRRDGVVTTLSSEVPLTSDVYLAPAWTTNRVAAATSASVELLSAEPLRRLARLTPFGTGASAPRIQSVRWSPGGKVLMVYGLQRQPEGPERHVVALLDSDGQPLREVEAYSHSDEPLVLQVGSQYFLVTEEATLAPIPAPAPSLDVQCRARAVEVVKEIGVSVDGILLPGARPGR